MTIKERVGQIDFNAVSAGLDDAGWHIIPALLSPDECVNARQFYRQDDLFRNTIAMGRHGFGQGEYRYFKYPLPDLVSDLRTSFFPHLSEIASGWNETLGKPERFPGRHEDYLRACAEAGQVRPTPLILRYEAGDYNCLHQDLYGEMAFPLQVAILLSKPGEDFEGGEFVLTEQRPRMQSRPHVAPLLQGDAIVFAVNERPKQGTRGAYRVKMRHGVSCIRSGERFTLGIIFHDAQ